ncbi:phage head closure protein [Roseateles cavernae]|uniref:phage head closure protein n=1 Tax=Roseateles cavernae TaxID=3153578 RepID=UPI0032E50DB5
MLKHLITIRHRAPGTDGAGQPNGEMVNLVDLWADIRHPSGIEAARGDAPVSTVRASIKVRLRSGITAAMQAVHGTTVYDIKAVLPDLVDRRYMFLVCEAST